MQKLILYKGVVAHDEYMYKYYINMYGSYNIDSDNRTNRTNRSNPN